MNKAVIHPQPEKFIKSLAPEPRQRIVRAIKALPDGDCKALEGRLAGYWRLRVGGYRIVYSDSVKTGARIFDCLFVERRSVVYELFEQLVVEQAMTGR